jgi:adenylyltransferase/sulfurtransferase
MWSANWKLSKLASGNWVRRSERPLCSGILPVCGVNPTVTELIDYNQFCGIAPEPAHGAEVKNGIPQITVQQLKQRLDKRETNNDGFLLLDVREPYEFQIAQIGGLLIPQNDLPNRLGELDKGREIIIHCRSGVRSQRAAELLKANGFQNVANLAGGILAWSDEIDPSVQKY